MPSPSVAALSPSPGHDPQSDSDDHLSLLRTYASSPTSHPSSRRRVPAAAARTITHASSDVSEASSATDIATRALSGLFSAGSENACDRGEDYLRPLLEIVVHVAGDGGLEAVVFRAQIAAWKALSFSLCKPRSVGDVDVHFRKQLLLAAGMAASEVLDRLLRSGVRMCEDEDGGADFARQAKILRFHVANCARFSRSFLTQRMVIDSSDACTAVMLRNLAATLSLCSLVAVSARKSLPAKEAKRVENSVLLPATVAARCSLLMCGQGDEAGKALQAAYGLTAGGVSQADLSGRLAAVAYFARMIEAGQTPTAESSAPSSPETQLPLLRDILISAVCSDLIPLVFQLCKYIYASAFVGRSRGGNRTLACIAASVAARCSVALLSSTSATDADVASLYFLLLEAAASTDALVSFVAQDALVAAVPSAPGLLAELMGITRIHLAAKASSAETVWLPTVCRVFSALSGTSDGARATAAALFPASLTACPDPLADIAGLHVLAFMYSSGNHANIDQRVLPAAGATRDMLSSFCKQTLLRGQTSTRLAEPCAVLLGYVTPARAAGGAVLACVKKSTSSTAVVSGVLRGLLTNVDSLPSEQLLRNLTAALPGALERHGRELAPAVALLCQRIVNAASAGHIGTEIGAATSPVLRLCESMTGNGNEWPAGAGVRRWSESNAEIDEGCDEHEALCGEERSMRKENVNTEEVEDVGAAVASLARAVAFSGSGSASLKGEVSSLAVLGPALATLLDGTLNS